MPWTLEPVSLITVFIVLFVASLGWHLAAWLLGRLLH
jgi:hypothetical protein